MTTIDSKEAKNEKVELKSEKRLFVIIDNGCIVKEIEMSKPYITEEIPDDVRDRGLSIRRSISENEILDEYIIERDSDGDQDVDLFDMVRTFNKGEISDKFNITTAVASVLFRCGENFYDKINDEITNSDVYICTNCPEYLGGYTYRVIHERWSEKLTFLSLTFREEKDMLSATNCVNKLCNTHLYDEIQHQSHRDKDGKFLFGIIRLLVDRQIGDLFPKGKRDHSKLSVAEILAPYK